MEAHLLSRPQKRVYSQEKTGELRDEAVSVVLASLLPNDQIEKIILIGSSIKGGFGEYKPPGFRGSLYSDFDFIVFVEDGYEIPEWLEFEPAGKPFSEDSLNHAYRSRKFIREVYDIEVFFIFTTTLNDSVVKEAEAAGIPMSSNSKHPHLIVFE